MTESLWTTFGVDAVTLSATITVGDTAFTVVRAIEPDAWYTLSEAGREMARQEVRLLLADKLVRSLAPVKVELPTL